jgi:hypothetical protein
MVSMIIFVLLLYTSGGSMQAVSPRLPEAKIRTYNHEIEASLL